jgi:predicted MPP superfamily phosphohydrolase
LEAAQTIPARPPTGVRIENVRRGPWLQLDSPAGFEWNRVELPIAGLPEALDGLRLVHMTDLHLTRKWTAAHDEIITWINREAVDAILFTGDFVDSKHDPYPAFPNVQRMMSALRSRLGTFAIIGNHDNDHLTARLPAWNVHYIGGRRVRFAAGPDPSDSSAAIELIGFPGAERHEADRDFLMPLVSQPKVPGTVRIVMSHYPDLIHSARPLRPDIYLCGHSHGGQICLPGGHAIVTHDSLPRHMATGVHRVGDTWFVANRGIGFATWSVRVFCPGEIIELKLRRAAD